VRGERIGVGAIVQWHVIFAVDAWVFLLAEDEVIGLAVVMRSCE
jgi:hypothetical protein